MIPSFNHQRNGFLTLKCPVCHGDNVHHRAVDVFDRDEDAAGIHVRVDRGSVTTDTNMDMNPSRRRHGLRIRLGCEECNSDSELLISQHKGETEVSVAIVEKRNGHP